MPGSSKKTTSGARISSFQNLSPQRSAGESAEAGERLALQQAAIARLGISALKEADLTRLQQEIVRQSAEILDVEFCELMEVCPDGDSLLLRAGLGWREGCIGNTVIDAGRGSQAGYTLLSKQPVVVEDLSEERRFDPSPLLVEHGVVSGLSVVIHQTESPYGVLGFHSGRRRRFSIDEVNFVQAIANLVGAAVERHHMEDEIRRNQRELRDFVDNATVGLHWVGPDGTILWANQAELDLLGYEKDEYIGRNIAEFHADSPAIEDILCRLSSGEELHGYEARLRTKDGAIRHVLISSNVLWENGRFVHTRCFTRDITERKLAQDALQKSEEELRKLSRSLERRVAERTAELQRRNSELQGFAYVASHDLREPLRKIGTFIDLALQESKDLSGSTLSYLERVQSATDRMMNLLDDLLTFARISTQPEPVSQVDLRKAAEDALSDLEVRLEETKGQVDVDPLPTIEASPSQMRQLLQNLIGNALKFHRPGVPPRVQVRATPVQTQEGREEEILLSVEDNGLGFDTKFSERIFQPFQRLHSSASFEGTGLGLAICRAIAERHGGRISVTSSPGEGSRFEVVLPVRSRVDTAALAVA